MTAAFQINLFVYLPLSLLALGFGVALASRAPKEDRKALWASVIVWLLLTASRAISAVERWPELDGLQAAVVLAVVANFWGATLLMLTAAIRHERERRSGGVAEPVA